MSSLAQEFGKRAFAGQAPAGVRYAAAEAFNATATGLSASVKSPLQQQFKQSSPMEPAQAAQPQMTVLQALAPDLETTVDVKPVTQHQVARDQQGVTTGMIQANQTSLNHVQTEVQDVKAGISDTIRQAQADIITATQEAGYDPAAMFPDLRVGGAGEAGLIGQATMTGTALSANGAGSLVTAASQQGSAASTLDMIAGDRAKGPQSREQALAEIADRLRAMSAPAQPEARNSFTLAANPAGEEQKPALDWETFLDQYGPEGIDTIMALDPDDPNPEVIPEWEPLDKLDNTIDDILDANKLVQDDLKEVAAPVSKVMTSFNLSVTEALALKPDDETVENAAKPEADLQDLKFGITYLVPETLNGLKLNGLTAAQAPKPDSEVKDVLAKLHHEPDPLKLGIASPALARPGGMAA